LIHVTPTMDLEEVSNEELRNALVVKLKDFKSLNSYVCLHDKLYPSAQKKNVTPQRINEDSIYATLHLQDLNSDQQFQRARELAFNGKLVEARTVCKKLLLNSPNYHDVRTLLGRSYSWDHLYDQAREQFQEVITRAPNYPDSYAGLAQVDYWLGNYEQALESIIKGLELAPNENEYIILKVKTLRAMERTDEALDVLQQLIKKNPKFIEAKTLQEKFLSERKQKP